MLRLWFPTSLKNHTYLQRFTLFKKLENAQKMSMKLKPGFSWKSISSIEIDPEHQELLNLLKTQNETQVGFTVKELTQEEFIFNTFL